MPFVAADVIRLLLCAFPALALSVRLTSLLSELHNMLLNVELPTPRTREPAQVRS